MTFNKEYQYMVKDLANQVVDDYLDILNNFMYDSRQLPPAEFTNYVVAASPQFTLSLLQQLSNMEKALVAAGKRTTQMEQQLETYQMQVEELMDDQAYASSILLEVESELWELGYDSMSEKVSAAKNTLNRGLTS